MVSFHRCGRQAEALRVCERARDRMVHELVIEPGPALRGLMETFLHHDPALATAASPRPARPEPRRRLRRRTTRHSPSTGRSPACVAASSDYGRTGPSALS
ncbi:BTAD domain-containing putative transcriptional regulator [Streptomyces sp. NWU339]|uniref:AfsR/SARP family transcriptional regulator n=1 Tax=Streptomyces sp. NWU339 TaxID=2185284 RepID=UPI00215AE25F|nr:BTAD domain-containing putative transcriptional regulator [Streptomyces sp. NWU339]